MMEPLPLDLTVRVGCRMLYEAAAPAMGLLMIKPRRDAVLQVSDEHFSSTPGLSGNEFQDEHNNIVYRVGLPQGMIEFHHDALVKVPANPDNFGMTPGPVPLLEAPQSVLRYTMPSRYCDSDNVTEFALQKFGHIPQGIELVQAISDWVHNNIEYRFGSGEANIAASQILARGYGVCRDFAHVAITLCRVFDIPARYVTGHLPDIGRGAPGTAMDFHAYFEAWLGQWFTFDARFNVPRIGRIKVAHGLDAVDGAIATFYGNVSLKNFEVWAYQVDPKIVSVNDPIDLSKRLDGTRILRSR